MGNQWIHVKERLPKSLEPVLGYIRGEGVHECYVDDGGYWHGLSFYGNPRVIYWMAMPEFKEET